jgi:hypothetical protein
MGATSSNGLGEAVRRTAAGQGSRLAEACSVAGSPGEDIAGQEVGPAQ